jgi:thioredoxin 1
MWKAYCAILSVYLDGNSYCYYLYNFFVCKQNLNFHKMAAVFTDNNFEAEVLKADKLSVIDFWAPWCGPCLALGPTIDALSKDYEGKVIVGKVNVDENPQLSINYGITSIPAVLFIKNGQVVDKQVGAAPKGVFEKKIQQHL